MRRLLFLFPVLLILLGAAQAEGVYYHNAYSQQETCYHATPLCIHADTSTTDAITLEEVRALGLLPCPVCVQEASDPQGVRAVARGGTYVLKMTDEWMNSRKDIGSVFGFTDPRLYSGNDIYKPLARRIHGDAYVAFLDAIQNGGTANILAYYPGIYPQNDELQMCQRHIGGAWYTALRPDEAARKAMAKNGKLKMYLRFFGGESTYADGTLTLGEGDEWGDDEYELKFEKMSSDAVFTREYDGLTLSLFEEIGANIFVLREHNADADLLLDVGLSLDGEDMGISLSGYMDGTDAVYVGVFTAPEAAQVKGGAVPAIPREPWITEEAYQGTDYAIVKKGTAGYGVVDRAGSFVIPPTGEEYGQDIFRNDDTFFVYRRNKLQSLRVVRIEGGTTVELARLDAPANGFVDYLGSNRAVFAVELFDGTSASWQIRNVDTGALLSELPIDESELDPPTGTFMGVNPSYVLETAKPERLVFGGTRGEGESEHDEFWLADNRGKRVSENWQYIEPLSWSDAGGLFLVSTWEEDEHTSWPNDQEDLFAGYDGRAWFGPHWRCGIIDHNGNLLAPCAYTKATLLSPSTVRLETPDGQEILVELKDNDYAFNVIEGDAPLQIAATQIDEAIVRKFPDGSKLETPAVMPTLEESCFSRENAPYWHKNPDCNYAETDWLKNDILGDQTRQIEVSQAESEGQKPCPGCAATFPPTFTGVFPDWPHTLAPWGYEKGDMVEDDDWPRGVVELPPDVVSTWGMPVEKLNHLFPEAWDEENEITIDPDYPDDYAGVYKNACGGFTFLLVDPTPRRVAEWRELLEGEFWVISAQYGWNDLRRLAKAAERILFADVELRKDDGPSYFHIVSVSVSQIANAVEIGVLPDGFDEGVQRIREALAEAGYSDPCMLRFVPENYPSWGCDPL